MESVVRANIPEDGPWQYEPKWDGFRCLAFREGDLVELQSKSGQPLARYFPEIVAAVRRLPEPRLALDGDIVVPAGDDLSFDDLHERIHPAASRVRRLSQEHPALLVVFDLLLDAAGPLVHFPLRLRRQRLEALARRAFDRAAGIVLSPTTASAAEARRWFVPSGGGVDTIVAKEAEGPYRSGERAMVEVKRQRTANCVVAGFRRSASGGVASLLLGLYEGDTLHYVGFTSSLRAGLRQELLKQIEPIRHGKGFTGRTPETPSRGTAPRADWEPLEPTLVAEVEYDHWGHGRFRHGTRLVRLRPDRHPRQCTIARVDEESRIRLAALIPAGAARR
jgi:ATP-dependent DNA ligase